MNALPVAFWLGLIFAACAFGAVVGYVLGASDWGERDSTWIEDTADLIALGCAEEVISAFDVRSCACDERARKEDVVEVIRDRVKAELAQ